jgi:hypothetical protein
MTNARIRKLMTLIAVFSLLSLEQSTLAQSQNQSHCRAVKATFVDVYSGGTTTSGTITHGGILNGTTLTAYTSTAFPTPVPTIVSYTGDLTLTTNHGQLKTSLVYIYDFGTGLFTVIGRIDPKTSTGRFAGATGHLFISGKTIGVAIPFTYPADIIGEICFPNGSDETDESDE